MAGEQNIGGVNFQNGIVKNHTEEQRTRKVGGKVEAYTEYSVWLNDGTKLEYSKEQSGASVSKDNSGTIFSGFVDGHITDTARNDRYTLEGCQGMLVDAERYDDGFLSFRGKPTDADSIIVKDKVNPDGTIIESKKNTFHLNENDEITLQEDLSPRTIYNDEESLLRQENARRADDMKEGY